MSVGGPLRQAAILLALIGLLPAIATPVALADADPASDILLGSPVFFPFQPPVSTSLQAQLEKELAELQKKGISLKVAIIASPVDLGAIPNMFGKPQTYADFLEREIAFNQPVALLVVMPSGFGTSHVPPGALSGLKVDATAKSDGLARSTILAVPRIAQAAGKPISAVAPGGSSGSGGAPPLLTFGAPALVVLIAVSLVAIRQRRTVGVSATENEQDPS